MSELLSVIVGGFIAICSGAMVQLMALHLKTQTEARERKAAKFEELVSAIYEYERWLEDKRARVVFGQGRPETISPYPKVLSISMMHFPEFLPKVTRLHAEGRNYEYWMFDIAQRKLASGINKLHDSFLEFYAPYNDIQEALLTEMLEYANRKFRVVGEDKLVPKPA
jgi:hypothetical protein